MSIRKHGSAVWTGDIKSGQGTVSLESGALDAQPYGFNTRFEGEPGTNPEELVGAAHAACFSMALSLVLADYDGVADSIDTRATVTLDKDGDGFSVTGVHLDVKGKVPGLDASQFAEAAETAKQNCPISRLYAGGTAEITMDVSFEA